MLPYIAIHILTMMKGFITLHHLEDDMKEWMPDLLEFIEKHASLSEELEQIKKSQDWIGLNKSMEDCSRFNQSILESRLMIEFFKLFATIDFKKAQSEGGQLDSLNHFAIQREISKEVLKIRNKMEKEF